MRRPTTAALSASWAMLIAPAAIAITRVTCVPALPPDSGQAAHQMTAAASRVVASRLARARLIGVPP